MKLRLTARGIKLTVEHRGFVTRRVHFSLGRFAGRIESLSVILSDVNGARGGVDTCCAIRIWAGLARPVVVRERQATVESAVALAVGRAERALQRHLRLAGVTDRRFAA